MKHPTWQPVTVSARPVDPNGEPIDFVLTPQDRDIVQLARIDIEANKRQFGRFTEGLCVTELSADDLSPQQRRDFGLEDA